MMTIGNHTTETVIETLAASIRAMSGEMDLLKAEAKGLGDQLVEQSIEYGKARGKLAQADGHNAILRNQVEQLQQRLREMKASIIRSGGVGESLRRQAILDSAEPTLTELLGKHNPQALAGNATERELADAKADSEEDVSGAWLSAAEMQDGYRLIKQAQRYLYLYHKSDLIQSWSYLTVPGPEIARAIENHWNAMHAKLRAQKAQELADAKAVNEEQDKYERTARGEPTTDNCPDCRGSGNVAADTIYPPRPKCPRCKGTGRVLVQEPRDAPPMTAKCPDCGGVGFTGVAAGSLSGKCNRCHGTGVALVSDDAPAHLDPAREGATDAAMSADAGRRGM